MISDSIGGAIRELGAARGLTQQQVARGADLEPALLSQIVNGRSNPAWGTLSRISAGLGIPLSVLLAKAEELEATAKDLDARHERASAPSTRGPRRSA